MILQREKPEGMILKQERCKIKAYRANSQFPTKKSDKY
jgi:hypothetical protein